jgi:hypothetical protein
MIIPDSVKVIHHRSFHHNDGTAARSAMKKIIFPKELTAINDYAFMRNTSLTSLKLQHTKLKTIGLQVF